ncbi:hypothetical protein R6Q57_001099 [Mikania cordata]
MAAAQITSERSSDLQLAVNVRKTPNSPVTDATVAQLFMSKTSPTAPLTPSSAKRKRLKPAKCHYSSINLEKKRLLSKDKAEHDHTRMTLSLRKGKAYKEKKTNESNAPVQISQTMIRAQEIQSTLVNEHPSFIKTMLRSHVS